MADLADGFLYLMVTMIKGACMATQIEVIYGHLRGEKQAFLRGGCFEFAKVLAQKTRLPIWGAFDDRGDLHHAFVFDQANGMAYDIRGEMPLHDVAVGSQAEGGTTREISEDFILGHIEVWDEDILKRARKAVTNRFRITKVAKKPAPPTGEEDEPGLPQP